MLDLLITKVIFVEDLNRFYYEEDRKVIMSERKGSHPAKKFYFLDYFYVLLKSISNDFLERETVFDNFKKLKTELQLGESKYKKLSIDHNENLSKNQENRYKYTFGQVINESEEYGLIKVNGSKLQLEKFGRDLLDLYSHNRAEFNLKLFEQMEEKYLAFNYLIKFLFKNNKEDGRIIFPHYSPRLLKMKRKSILTTKDIITYSHALAEKLETDLKKYLNKDYKLYKNVEDLIGKLYESKILESNPKAYFNPGEYNKIIKRHYDYWLKFFLKEIYHYPFSLSAFDVWSYRAKQIGIVHVSELYYGFSGKIIYPIGIISPKVKSKDFKRIYEYSKDESLFIHIPEKGNTTESQEVFARFLFEAYHKLKERNKTYFVNLISLRELVCYKMKISESTFTVLLEMLYKLNLAGQSNISISLESDKLPEETNVMYLKREPVMIAGKYRNIIAVDITKGKGK
jgi:hypothetical protein